MGHGGHLHLSLRRDGLPLLQNGAGPGGLTLAGQVVLATLLQELQACPAP